MKFAYADPPYPGMAKKYKDHPDYAGEIDHAALVRLLCTYDGWALHTASTTLAQVLAVIADMARQGFDPGPFRVQAWVKPFASFKGGVPVAYAWEPVLVKPVRKPVGPRRIVMRDWIAENITMRRGLIGAKPEKVCQWVFETAGLEPTDDLCDLYPGTGAVTIAWENWRKP